MTETRIGQHAQRGLEGSVALITGAGGDIGSTTARRLAEAGVAVAVADHPDAREDLDATVDACLSARPTAAVLPVPFDVTDQDAADDALDAVTSNLGVVNLVFNNAGIQGEFAPTPRYPREDAAAVINVNVLGAFNVLRATTAAMVDAGVAGSVVNMASMAGVTGAPNMVAYSASKAAVIGMTRSAAKDLAPHGIRVNSVSPAFIGPGVMWERQVAAQAEAGSQYFPDDAEKVAEMMISTVPMRRYGSRDEVAEVVLWLLSDLSSYVTGINLEVSGGAA